MPHELLLLRHAKSDWSREIDDFERPLNARGSRDAARMGRWLAEHTGRPDRILSSPARRAAQTAEAVCAALGIDRSTVVWEDRLYLAPLPTLIAVVSGLAASLGSVLLIGHNPGLEDLLSLLCRTAERHRHQEKLLTTATLAHLRLPGDDWTTEPQAATLVNFLRARDLE